MQKKNTYQRRLKINIILLLSIVLVNQSYAQKDCTNKALVNARKAYDIGRFEDVIEVIGSCNKFEEDIEGNLLEESYVILASTYVAMDDIPNAEKYIINLINLNPNFQYRNEDPVVFKLLIDQAKRGNFENQISSVSKVSESLFEAPATVLLITSEQIKRRGYQDLEALLHDLPGFDISRSNGVLYSNVYQRGYRSDNTNRTLFLVDGVEDNDLWGNIAYMSRQYPISNIKNVEVMYGPASTIYGANAFLGVISINTKKPIDMVREGRILGVRGEIGSGDWNTSYGDVTIAGSFPKNQVEFSVTGRVFFSDESNWGDLEDFDFAQQPFEDVKDDYLQKLTIDRTSNKFDEFVANSGTLNPGYYNYNIGSNGDTLSIVPTEEGLRKAWDYDDVLLSQTSYQDQTSAYAVSARLKIAEMTIGWNLWQKSEGTGAWYNDYARGTTEQGQGWKPNSNSFFLRYDKSINRKLSFTSFTRYKVHGYSSDNQLSERNAYGNERNGLLELVSDKESSWTNLYLTVRSNQVRSESRIIFRPSSRFSIISGVEARFSAIQANYAQSLETDPEESADLEDELNTVPLGGNHFFTRDLGVFSQANLRVTRNLKMTLGGRIDNNRIRTDEGYGTQFNPRVAIIYSPKDYIFKAIFAQAFKDATFFDRYSTISGVRDVPAIDLEPEEVKNYEVTVRKLFNEYFNIEAGGYLSTYINSIETKTFSGVFNGVEYENTNIFRSTGQRRIYGGFLNLDYEKNNWAVFANYSYTVSVDNSDGLTDVDGSPVNTLLVADIAPHQLNAGTNYRWNNFNFNLRANWIDRKPVGAGTTVPGNTADFPAYIIMNGAITYHLFKTGLSVQVVGNNLLDEIYYSPGVRAANGQLYSMRLPQNRRNFQFKVRYDF